MPVGTTAVKILGLSPRRKKARIFNNAANAIYIGGDNQVNSTNGYPIPAGTSLPLSREDGDDTTLEVYGISTVAAQDVRIFETLE